MTPLREAQSDAVFSFSDLVQDLLRAGGVQSEANALRCLLVELVTDPADLKLEPVETLRQIAAGRAPGAHGWILPFARKVCVRKLRADVERIADAFAAEDAPERARTALSLAATLRAAETLAARAVLS